MKAPDVVLRFLESVGRRSEAEYYLNLFRAEPKERFAAISVDANVARHATEAVVLHLRFLSHLGLYPMVVLGLFEPTDAEEHGARIRRRLEREGVAATLLRAGEPADLLVQASAAARGGVIPIILLGFAQGATHAERLPYLGDLLRAVQTRKLIFLHRPGGLRQGGVLLPIVNLTKDVPQLAASRELSRKEKAMLLHSQRLVELVPHKFNVAITSPLNLFRELFTTKCAGTLMRKGAVITVRQGLADVDPERLRALISSSFGRAPFERFFERNVGPIYLEEGYRGTAIIQNTALGAYLTKFAVDREAQGEGLGRDLWDAMTADLPVLFWRSRAANPIHEWYTKQADGLQKAGEWTVFWKGVAPANLPSVIDFTLSQTVDLPPPPAELP